MAEQNYKEYSIGEIQSVVPGVVVRKIPEAILVWSLGGLWKEFPFSLIAHFLLVNCTNDMTDTSAEDDDDECNEGSDRYAVNSSSFSIRHLQPFMSFSLLILEVPRSHTRTHHSR